MEYCFTSEGTDQRPQASSLRGLDAATYYRHNGVLNCGHACVRQLIMDSLHHWALEYQVDGFCFVNAETLVQGALLIGVPTLHACCSSHTCLSAFTCLPAFMHSHATFWSTLVNINPT